MAPARREACRRDLEAAGAAMGRVFDATGDAEAYAARMMRLMLMIGSAKLLGKSIGECYQEARPGVPSDWWPFLDPLFAAAATVPELAP